MTDISQNELYIKRYEGAYKDYIPKTSIPFCRPRLFDGFVYILGGACRYEFSTNTRLEAHSGDILYLPQGAVYKMNVLERYDFICINFCFDTNDIRSPSIFRSKDIGISENLFYRAWKNHSSSSLANKMSVLYRIYNEIILSKQADYLQGGMRAKIEEAVSIISGNLQSTITVSDLAHHAKMSEVYFRKLFKSVTGTSPSKFMIDCRIGRAKELLFENYLTLEDISERCGFSSPSYFCRVFKENTGMTPSEFRGKLSM